MKKQFLISITRFLELVTQYHLLISNLHSLNIIGLVRKVLTIVKYCFVLVAIFALAAIVYFGFVYLFWFTLPIVSLVAIFTAIFIHLLYRIYYFDYFTNRIFINKNGDAAKLMFDLFKDHWTKAAILPFANMLFAFINIKHTHFDPNIFFILVGGLVVLLFVLTSDIAMNCFYNIAKGLVELDKFNYGMGEDLDKSKEQEQEQEEGSIDLEPAIDLENANEIDNSNSKS